MSADVDTSAQRESLLAVKLWPGRELGPDAAGNLNELVGTRLKDVSVTDGSPVAGHYQSVPENCFAVRLDTLGLRRSFLAGLSKHGYVYVGDVVMDRYVLMTVGINERSHRQLDAASRRCHPKLSSSAPMTDEQLATYLPHSGFHHEPSDLPTSSLTMHVWYVPWPSEHDTRNVAEELACLTAALKEGGGPGSYASANVEAHVARDGPGRYFREDFVRLELSILAQNTLHRVGLWYTAQLVQLTREILLSQQGVGEATAREVEWKLGDRGLALGMALDPVVRARYPVPLRCMPDTAG
jgi:hypothetical protein